MGPSPDGDLYAPTLDERHDAVDIQPPWRPDSLLIPTFFGGAFTGAILYAVNARFLGRSRSVPWIALVFSLVGVAIVVANVAYQAEFGAPASEEAVDRHRVVRFGMRLAPLIVAFLVGRTLQGRYRLYQEADRPLLGPGLLAVVAGWFFYAVLALAVEPFFFS